MSDAVTTYVTYTKPDGSGGIMKTEVPTAVSRNAAGKPVYGLNVVWGTPDGVAKVGAGQQENVVEPYWSGPGGHRFVICTHFPVSAAADGGGSEAEISTFLDAFEDDADGTHRSDSIDYTYVISGEVVMVIDDEEVTVKAGECVVMRGTNHAWFNRTQEPCVVACVLVGAERE